MTEQQEAAMRQALEALEHIDYEDNDRDFLFPYQCTMLDNAITALRRIFEQQPAGEPVGDDKVKQLVKQCTHRDVDGNWYVDGVQLVHATCFAIDAAKRRPQPAAWVGLTDEEIYDMYNEPRSDSEMLEFAREIEATLRSKNT